MRSCPLLETPLNRVEVGTLIVGAGPAGLAVAGALRRRGCSFTIVEKTANVGARWRTHYDRLHLHTLKSLSALPHKPFPRSVARYPSRDEVVDYLEAYANDFQIEPQYGQELIQLERVKDRWSCATTDIDYRARQVVMATGYNRIPVVPQWPGVDEFSGGMMHSLAYRNAEGYEGKRVLVVGAGNTGAEIALDLCENGAEVWISVRSPMNVVARDPWGVPAQVAGLVLSTMPRRWADRVGALAQRSRYGDLSAYGLRASGEGAATRLLRDGKVALVDIGTMEKLRTGAIKVVTGIRSFKSTDVEFEDGRTLPFDSVVLATGYRAALEALIKDTEGLFNDRGVPRIHGKESAQSGLFFVGFRNALSGQLRHIRLDAMRAARVIASRDPGFVEGGA